MFSFLFCTNQFIFNWKLNKKHILEILLPSDNQTFQRRLQSCIFQKSHLYFFCTCYGWLSWLKGKSSVCSLVLEKRKRYAKLDNKNLSSVLFAFLQCLFFLIMIINRKFIISQDNFKMFWQALRSSEVRWTEGRTD